jgi:O-antigen ligase/cytochrome c-type biogenesis protein CcmH/NrfG
MTKTIENILLYVVLAGIFLLPFIPLIVSSSLFFPYITGKAFAFRIIVEIIVAVWAVLAILNLKYRPRRSPVLFAVIGLVAVSTLATVFGSNPYHSFWSNFERMEGLVTYLHLLGYFVVMISVLKTQKLWSWFLNLSLAVSLIVGFLALNQWLGHQEGGFRADATLGNPIYLAVYALIHFFLALYIVVRSSEKWPKVIYGIIALFEILVIYLTATRSALLGLVGGIFVATLLVALFERERPRLRRSAIGISLAVLIGVGGFWLAKDAPLIQGNPVLSRLANISLQDGTTRHRLIVWSMGWQGVKERPILGWGPENFNLVFNKYYDPALYGAETWFDRSHNILIDWLVHAGILGLVSYLGLFAVAVYCVWRRTDWRVIEKSIIVGLLAAYLIHNLFVFDNLISYLLFFALLGYLHFSGRDKQEKQSEKKLLPLKSEPPLVLWLSLPIFIALVLAVYSINIEPMVAGGRLVQAISFSPEQINSMEALDAYVEQKKNLFGRVFDSGTMANGEAREQLLTFTLRLIRNQQVPNERKQELATMAEKQMLAQLEQAPDDARSQLFFGSFLSNIGNTKDGLRYLETASSLSPRKLAILFELASVYLQSGDKIKALEVAKKAYDLSPTVEDSVRIYPAVLLENNRKEEAKKIITDLLATGATLDDKFINTMSRLGMYDQVVRLWQQKVEKDPSDAQSRFSLAAAYLQVGDKAKAIAELEWVKKDNPADLEISQQVDQVIKEIRSGRNPLKK